MPLRNNEPVYLLKIRAMRLRNRAMRLRDIAKIQPRSPVTPQLLDMAADLERRADELEREQGSVEPDVTKVSYSRRR